MLPFISRQVRPFVAILAFNSSHLPIKLFTTLFDKYNLFEKFLYYRKY